MKPRRALKQKTVTYPEDLDEPPTGWHIRALSNPEVGIIKDGTIRVTAARGGPAEIEILAGRDHLVWVRFGLVSITEFGDASGVCERVPVDHDSPTPTWVTEDVINLIPWPVVEFLAARVKDLTGIKETHT